VREKRAFAPLGLVNFPFSPPLTPWALFLSRFEAVRSQWLFHCGFAILVFRHSLKALMHGGIAGTG